MHDRYEFAQGGGGSSWTARRRGRRSGALCMARPVEPCGGQYVVAVNERYRPDNADALLWAMSYRANPALDLQILHHRDQGHGPRSKRNDGRGRLGADRRDDEGGISPRSRCPSASTGARKGNLEELGLPKLKPESPWFRLLTRGMPDETRARGGARGERRLLRDRKAPGPGAVART